MDKTDKNRHDCRGSGMQFDLGALIKFVLFDILSAIKV